MSRSSKRAKMEDWLLRAGLTNDESHHIDEILAADRVKQDAKRHNHKVTSLQRQTARTRETAADPPEHD